VVTSSTPSHVFASVLLHELLPPENLPAGTLQLVDLAAVWVADIRKLPDRL